MNERQKGIIFDLDNTLLHSHIDFSGMKKTVAQWLMDQGVLDSTQDSSIYTTSQLINQAKASGHLSLEQENNIWQLIGKFEEDGMQGATLEDGVKDTLAQLKSQDCSLFVLTNNAYQAAITALQETGIHSYFRKVYGREQVPALKPSPSGIQRIIREHHPIISQNNWLMIGDSWIDGKAAHHSGIPFLLYNGRESDLKVHQVPTKAHIKHFQDIIKYI